VRGWFAGFSELGQPNAAAEAKKERSADFGFEAYESAGIDLAGQHALFGCEKTLKNSI